MVLQFFGHPEAICAQRLAIILHEKKVPFEYHNIDMWAGAQKNDECKAFQPFGQLPWIIDDGFVLYESRAIARYIALKYADQGTPLIPFPTDLVKTALFEQAASIESSRFEPYASVCGYQKVFYPLMGIPSDDNIYNKAFNSLSAQLDVYDEILGRQKYLAGDDLTLADLFHIPWGAILKTSDSDILQSKPNVARWWNDITSRPSVITLKEGITSVNKYD